MKRRDFLKTSAVSGGSLFLGGQGAGAVPPPGNPPAALVTILSVSKIPVTEQGKPDREAIMHLAR